VLPPTDASPAGLAVKAILRCHRPMRSNSNASHRRKVQSKNLKAGYGLSGRVLASSAHAHERKPQGHKRALHRGRHAYGGYQCSGECRLL